MTLATAAGLVLLAVDLILTLRLLAVLLDQRAATSDLARQLDALRRATQARPLTESELLATIRRASIR